MSPCAQHRAAIQSSSVVQYLLPKSTTGKWSTLPVWIERQRLEQLVSVPKPPGKMTKPSLGFTKHDLARIEVVEGVFDVEVLVRCLLVRQLDVEAD